ncbi:tetratricopeptide repeat protein, partial [Candidatus Dependentiae bacterium]
MAYWLYEYTKALELKLETYPNDVNALIELGYLYMDHFHDGEKSLNYLKEAIKIDPKECEIMFWMAKTYRHQICDIEKAKSTLQTAIKIDPNRADCNDYLAHILWCSGGPEKQVVYHLKKAIKAEPTWIRPKAALCNYYIKKHNFIEAQKVAKEAVEAANNIKTIRPKTPSEEYYEKYVTGRYPSPKEMSENLFIKIDNEKLATKNFGDNKNRIKAISQELKKNPNNEKLVVEKSFILAYEINQLDEAIETLEKAFKNDSENPSLIYWLSCYYLEKDESSKAQEILLRAVKLYPEKAEFHFLLSKASLKFGHIKDITSSSLVDATGIDVAIPHLKRVIKLEPT